MTAGLLASLITSLAGPSTPAAPARPRAKPRGIPPPDNIRKAQAARMAAVAARCAEFDAALLAACAYGPRSATSLAHQLNTNPSRIKRAARRLERLGHVRVVTLPYPGQAPRHPSHDHAQRASRALRPLRTPERPASDA